MQNKTILLVAGTCYLDRPTFRFPATDRSWYDSLTRAPLSPPYPILLPIWKSCPHRQTRWSHPPRFELLPTTSATPSERNRKNDYDEKEDDEDDDGCMSLACMTADEGVLLVMSAEVRQRHCQRRARMAITACGSIPITPIIRHAALILTFWSENASLCILWTV